MRSLLRRIVPAVIRTPLGRWRRYLIDDIRRLTARRPYPPRELLREVQSTPFLEEYVDVGQASARLVEQWLGDDLPPNAKVLDFGCGCARTITFLQASWNVHGCDIHQPGIEWCKAHVAGATFFVNDEEPPLPFSTSSFDAAWAISIFTHMPVTAQRRWLEELHRVLRPDSRLLLTTMGVAVHAGLDPDAPAHLLNERGVVFRPRGTTFNESAAFHTPEGLEQIATSLFAVERYEALALKGFQDAYLLAPIH